jgi:hypothetical protein
VCLESWGTLNISYLILGLELLITRNRIGAPFTDCYEDMTGWDETQAQLLDWHTW